MATAARILKAFKAVQAAQAKHWPVQARVIDAKTGEMEIVTCIRRVKMAPEAVVAMCDLLVMTPFI